MEKLQSKKIKLYKDYSKYFNQDILYTIAIFCDNSKDIFLLLALNKKIYNLITDDSRIINLFFKNIKIPIDEKYFPSFINLVENIKLKKRQLSDTTEKLSLLKSLSIYKNVVIDSDFYEFENLTELNIYNNKTLYEIGELDNLLNLTIDSCIEIDSSKINCNNLTYLSAANIIKVNGIFQMDNLKYLNLSNVEARFGAMVLSKLKNLTKLNISGSSVSYLYTLKLLTSLKNLIANNLKLETYPIQHLSLADSVTKVDFSYNTNISYLEGENIEILNISNIYYLHKFNYACLNELKKIKVLHAKFCQDLIHNNIKDLKCLTELDTHNCLKIEGSCLNNFTNLKKLNCNHNNIKQTKLAIINNLEYLSINKLALSYDNFTLTNNYFYQCNKLKILNIFENRNVDSSIFKYIPQLQDIRIDRVNVMDNDLLYLVNCEFLLINNAGNGFLGKTLNALPKLKCFCWYDSDRNHLLNNYIVKLKKYKRSELKQLTSHLASIEWKFEINYNNIKQD